jgi:tetratricopeptide (TPR) repeat protein
MARDDFRFEPGAIAVHIHSFSAATLRDARANWAAPLLAHGAAATLGNVYEPYLGLTPNLDLFADRLRNGLNFAESAYAAEPVLSWMTTFVGDPLYRPFQTAETEANGKPAIEYAAYKKGARAWFEKGRTEGTLELQASARQLKSGIVWEGLGLLQWSVPYNDPALDSFREAEKCYGKTEDGLRTVLHQAEILKAKGKMDQARSLAAKALERYKEFHGIVLLRAIIGLPAPESGK